MTTQTLVTCNGKINQHGFCDKCYQQAYTTSNQCGRLVPYQQAGINMVLAVSGHFEISFKSIRKDTTVYFDVYKDDGKFECVMNVYKNRELELAYGGDFETCINKLHEYQAACATAKGEERKE